MTEVVVVGPVEDGCDGIVVREIDRKAIKDLYELRLQLEHMAAPLTVKLKKGSYKYVCTIPGHADKGMKGTFRVT